MKGDYADDLHKLRSLLIVEALQKRDDVRAVQKVKSFSSKLEWDKLHELMIDSHAWDYVVTKKKYNPVHVFCHPKILIEHPETSLYYRGLCAMSLKAVKGMVGSIENMESGSLKRPIQAERAMRIARVYNTYICSIIQNSTAWTIENGYRTITAALGITFDGKMRNVIGSFAERRVRTVILEHLLDRGLIVSPSLTIDQVISGDYPAEYILVQNVSMRFGSEPDIAFRRDAKLLCTVEVKGGTDPAGALERYGAAKKSCEEAIRQNPHCKNFYIGGVFTAELTKRIEVDRLVAYTYKIVEILDDPDKRKEFFNELFHHVLRIV